MATTPASPLPASVEPGNSPVRGRAIRLGLVGSILALVGGLGVGDTPKHDPLLSNTVWGIWRYGHGKMLAAAVLYIGIALLVWAWIRLGRAVQANQVDVAAVVRAVVVWTVPLLLVPPLFTTDPYSYLAQGALANAGYDPYTTGASQLSGPLTENVPEVWFNSPSPYGPLFIMLLKGVVTITGDNLVLGVILTRLVMVCGLVLVCAALPGLCRHLGGRPAFALWLAAANPLTLLNLVAGAHNDLLMVGLMLCGTLFVLNRRHVHGFALVAAAFAVKATAALILPFLVWVWMAHRKDSSRVRSFAITAGLGVVTVAAVLGGLTLLAEVDLGWVGVLGGNAVVDLWLSLPAIVGKIAAPLVGLFADVDPGQVVGIVRLVGWVVLAAVLGRLWWTSRQGGPTAIRNAAFALLATVVLSPVAFAWYFGWPLVLAAAFAIPSTWTALIGAVSVWLVLFTFPDGATVHTNWIMVVATIATAVFTWVQLRRALQIEPLSVWSRKRGSPATAAPEHPSP